MRRKLVKSAWPVTLLALAAGLLAFAVAKRSDVPGGPFVDVLAGKQAADRPDLAGETLRGEPFSLEQLHGKPVIVNVWASW